MNKTPNIKDGIVKTGEAYKLGKEKGFKLGFIVGCVLVGLIHLIIKLL